MPIINMKTMDIPGLYDWLDLNNEASEEECQRVIRRRILDIHKEKSRTS